MLYSSYVDLIDLVPHRLKYSSEDLLSDKLPDDEPKELSCSIEMSKTKENPQPSLDEVFRKAMVCPDNKLAAESIIRNREKLLWVDPITRVSAAVYVIKWSNPNLIDLLLQELKNNIDESLDLYDNTALQQAVQWGRDQLVLRLLKMGANPNHINKGNRSALHRAALLDRPDILNMLLEYGGDINIKGPFGWRPIHSVFFSRNQECMDLILRSKPDIDARNSWKQTVLSLYIEHGLHHPAIIAKLLDHGCDPNFLAYKGFSYLHVLASNPDNEKYFAMRALQLLVDHGIDVNAQTMSDNSTALHLAIEKNQKCIAPLLYHNADLTMRDKFNETPLQKAVRNSSSSIPMIIAKLVLNDENFDSSMFPRFGIPQIRNRYHGMIRRSKEALNNMKYTKVYEFPNISYYDILTHSDYENAQKFRNEDFRENVRMTTDLFCRSPYYRYHFNMKMERAFKLYEVKRIITNFLFEHFYDIMNIFMIEHIIDYFDEIDLFRLYRQIINY